MIKNIKRFIIQDIKFDVLLMMPIVFMILCILVMALYPEIIRWLLIIFLFFIFEPCFTYLINKWQIAKSTSAIKDNYNDRE